MKGDNPGKVLVIFLRPYSKWMIPSRKISKVPNWRTANVNVNKTYSLI